MVALPLLAWQHRLWQKTCYVQLFIAWIQLVELRHAGCHKLSGDLICEMNSKLLWRLRVQV
jgi:hypothetical protein